MLSVFVFLSHMIAYHELCHTSAKIFSVNLGKVTELCWIKLSFGLQTAGPQGWAFQGDSASTFAHEQRSMFHGCVHCSELRRQECFCLSLQILFALKLKCRKKTRTFHKSFQAPSLSLISQITEKKIERGKHKDNHVMTHIHLVILISQGTLRNVITTHIHVVGCPSIYIFILQMSDIIPVLINIITTF